jgi:hypothetical protein
LQKFPPFFPPPKTRLEVGKLLSTPSRKTKYIYIFAKKRLEIAKLLSTVENKLRYPF